MLEKTLGVRNRRLLTLAIGLLVALGVVGAGVSCLVRKLGGDFRPGLESTLSSSARALVGRALEGIDVVADYHVHILGTGTSGSGAWVNPRMQSWLHPVDRLEFAVYMSASGIEDDADSDRQFVARLLDLALHMGRPMRLFIVAFDRYHGSDGKPNLDKTNFYVPNAYVFELAAQRPDVLVPVMSVHPYREDAVAELERWAARGGRVVKWLPNAMGIDPAAPRLDRYYDAMAGLGLVLLSHAGEEKAVDADEDQKLGNPLRLRRALDRGVKVIVAHCASLGDGEDLDDPARPSVPNFRLFLRLMEDERYDGLVFGELSGLTQWNRLGEPLHTMLARTNLHARLVNGSDYPLPAVNVLISLDDLEDEGYISAEESTALGEIYHHNPLLFDLVLRRTVRHPETGTGFADAVFGLHPAIP